MFAYVGFALNFDELEAVTAEVYLRQGVVVSLQDFDYRWEQHDVELCASLDACSARKDECAVVFFGGGEVGGHEVGE